MDNIFEKIIIKLTGINLSEKYFFNIFKITLTIRNNFKNYDYNFRIFKNLENCKLTQLNLMWKKVNFIYLSNSKYFCAYKFLPVF